jgi:hypothetical protein
MMSHATICLPAFLLYFVLVLRIIPQDAIFYFLIHHFVAFWLLDG